MDSKIILISSLATILVFVLTSRLFPIDNDVKRSLGYPEDSLLNFTELSERYGYDCEQHTVVTDDGYILTIFRIKSRNCAGKTKRTPVILMHGFLLSSDLWLEAGPNFGLAYLISDECYDLWVGNQRGNYYSRQHVRLDPDKDAKYWHFSVDEIGLYDIPATIDYVLRQTRENKLNYVGYSQGGCTFLIMCSERPGYCDKVNVFIGLAPGSRLTHIKSTASKILLEVVRIAEGALSAIGVNELFSKGSVTQELLALLCKFRASENICASILTLIDSSHPGSINKEVLRTSFGHSPAGTSVRTIARYGQALKTDRFQKYDYGKERNLEIYGEQQPPSYNLSTVTVPFITFYGNNDFLIDKKDVLWLVEQLPNVLEVVKVADPLWNHFDVPYSQFTRELIFPKIKDYLSKYSKV